MSSSHGSWLAPSTLPHSPAPSTSPYSPSQRLPTSSYVGSLIPHNPSLSRPDVSSACLGWICCCSPLPLSTPVAPWTFVGVRRPTSFATTSSSSRIDLPSVCLGWNFVVPRYPLSAPVRQSSTLLLLDRWSLKSRHLIFLSHSVRFLLMYTASG
jgi:hypothetical protein